MTTFQFKAKKSKNYFEGWYVRIIDQNKGLNMAFIFAITYNEDDPHAFIQAFSSSDKACRYIRYELEDFTYQDETVHIGPNTLSQKELIINLPHFEVNGQFIKPLTLKPQYNTNSAMGYLERSPLECYQEVIHMNGTFAGTLKRNNVTHEVFGSSYIEKTYGSKFPSEWIWLQANQFDSETSFSFSYGLIPIWKFKVKGFFAILKHKYKEYRFASYNFSSFIHGTKKNTFILQFKKRNYTLEIELEDAHKVILVGPSKHAKMNRDVFESLEGIVSLKLYKKNNLILETKSEQAAFEWMLEEKKENN